MERAVNKPRFIAILCLSILLMVLGAGAALAADIVVDADCSLPNAVLSANGEAMAAPQAECEAGDAADANSETNPTGSDTITVDVSGTHDGVITLGAALAISSDIVIEGKGYAVDGGGIARIFDITAGSLTVRDLTMTDGHSWSNGGAIAVNNASLTLNNSVVSSSGAWGMGGGIYAVDSDISLIDSVVSGNATGAKPEPDPTPTPAPQTAPAEESGEGEVQAVDAEAEAAEAQAVDAEAEAAEAQHVGDEPAEAQGEETATPEPTPEPDPLDTLGGGIYFASSSNNTLIIEKSGLDSNDSPSTGGGLYIASGEARVSDSTFSGNDASTEAGALYNAGDSRLAHITVTDNSSAATGGIVDASVLQLYNSILADNDGGDCSGALNANIGNILHDGSCNHDGITSEPNLLLLAGSPEYYLPQAGSPAIDAASAEFCTETDQRGIDRPAEACDIGAAEHQPGVFRFQIQSALAAHSPAEPASSDGGFEPAPTPLPSTCVGLASYITLSGYDGYTYCKLLDAVGVGNQLVIDHGMIYAVDIYGSIPSALKACYTYHTGAFIVLDAATSPREIVPLRTTTEGNMKCAIVDRAGSVILMPLEFFTAGLIADPVWNLIGCTVTTTDILNLRSQPSAGSEIVANVLNDVQLTADQRATNYFRVKFYNLAGWLSKDYLRLSGSCE